MKNHIYENTSLTARGLPCQGRGLPSCPQMVACGHSRGSHSTEERPSHFSALPSRMQVNVPQPCLWRSKSIYRSARTTCHALIGSPNMFKLLLFQVKPQPAYMRFVTTGGQHSVIHFQLPMTRPFFPGIQL